MTYRCKPHNRIQEIEETLSGVDNTLENIHTTVKESSKHRKLLTYIQEIQDTMKRQNGSIIGIEERYYSQFKGPESIFNNIIEVNFPNLKKEMAISIQEAYIITNRLDWTRKENPLIT